MCRYVSTSAWRHGCDRRVSATNCYRTRRACEIYAFLEALPESTCPQEPSIETIARTNGAADGNIVCTYTGSSVCGETNGSCRSVFYNDYTAHARSRIDHVFSGCIQVVCFPQVQEFLAAGQVNVG